MKILIADDQPYYVYSLVELLRNEGHVVDSAGTGLAAAVCSKINGPHDFVFCDWEMPNGGGDQFLKEGKYPKGKTFIVSGGALTPNETNYLLSVGVGFISKSLDTIPTILSIVETYK